MSNFWIRALLVSLVFVIFKNEIAEAYIGLGPLVPILGGIIMYIFIGVITFLGIILYPIRWLQKKFKSKKEIQNKKD